MPDPQLQAACEAEVARRWQDQRDGAHDLGHLRRVWRNCQRILAEDGLAVDTGALLVAAYFHDVVNLPKDAPNRAQAAALSAEVAAQWLTARGWHAARIATVTHAIAAHSFSAGLPPETAEARILRDADRLEALGALGLARMFCVAGAMGAALFDDADPMALHRPLDDRRYALDHLEVKLFGLVDGMTTETGRRLAQEAADWMASFRTRLLREIG